MIIPYFTDYFEKIKSTKKLAREKNIPVWFLPVFDSLLVSVLISWELSLGTLILLDKWQSIQDYAPWYMEILWEIFPYSFLIYFGIIVFSILDKMIMGSIHIHAFLNKLFFKIINRADMYIWKKTGRDSVISSIIWRIQRKFMSRSKRQRRQMIMVMVSVIVVYYVYRFAS